MKYERRNQFKSNIFGNNKILLLSVFMAIIFAISIFMLFNNGIAYAEEIETLTTPQILNFNQLFNFETISNTSNFEKGTNGIIKIISTSAFEQDTNTDINLIRDNEYFAYIFTDCDCGIEFYTSGAYNKNIYETQIVIPNYTGSTNVYIRRNSANNTGTLIFYFINLTLMYGENTPTLEECQQIFTSDYYNYTTGTPVNANYFSNYLDAYNDIMQSYKYQLSTTALSNYTFSYDYNNNESYFEYRDDSQTWYFLNTFAVPLFTKINANAQVTINYYFYAPNFTLDYYLNIMAYDTNGNLITIFTETKPIDTGNAQQTTFSVPFDVDVLFFNCRYNNNIITSANFMVFNFELSANQLDLTTLAFNAQESAREYYERYYGVGGQGYNNIYNAGYGAGSESQKPFTDTWDFIGQSFHGVGEILSMQLIPGLPLGLFVALPLLVGLLFFIVKIAKGSGG